MKTALTQAIENINKRVEELKNMDEVNNLWKSSCAAELLTQREYLTSLLPTEKDIIVSTYASSVEKLLKDRQTELINDKPNAISSEEQAQFDLLIVELALILNQLKTLKPL